MNSLATRSASNARRLLTVAAAFAALGSVTSAQAQFLERFKPGTLYVAGSLGLMATSQECQGAPTCEQDRIGGKMFGGYRFTPNLATEIGYFYLGKFVAAGPSSSYDVHNRAITFGLDWSNEMFGIARQHIRFGVAHVTTAGAVASGSNSPTPFKEEGTQPYLGLGLSYQFNDHVRFYSSYDTMRNKSNKKFHVMSIGMGIEN